MRKCRSVARGERAFRGDPASPRRHERLMPLLIITGDESNLSRRCRIEVDRFTIGRSRDSSVSIPHRSVSKTHLELERTPGGYSFRDLASKNGTFLNEERRQNGVLRDGDVVRLGKVRITFRDLPAAKPDGAPVSASAPAIGASAPAGATSAAAGPATAAAGSASAPTGSASAPARRSPAPAIGAAIPAPGAFVPSRAERRWRRRLISLGVGALGIGLGLLVGRIGSLLAPPDPASQGAKPSLLAGGPVSAPADGRTGIAANPATRQVPPSFSREDGGSAGAPPGVPSFAGPPLPAKPPLELAPKAEAVLPAGPGAEAAGVAASWVSDLERPYTDPGESSRVLFRLFLDVLGRPPTRGEAREFLPLEHAERWSRLRKLGGAPAEIEGARTHFRTFLGRDPSIVEEVALRVVARGDSHPRGKVSAPDPGLLLTSSGEYRSADRRRLRTRTQWARSLIVDLLDRPPESEEEVREVEKAIGEHPGPAAARVLAFSKDATAALPDLPGEESGSAKSAARSWIDEEFRRFFERAPAEAEVRALLAELKPGKEGPRRIRLALADSPGYRSY